MPTYDRQPPLTDRELRILRGMLDDHEFRRRQREFWGTAFGDFRVIVGFVGALILIGVQAAELWLIVAGR